MELNARASYHNLLESDAGYTPNAQIELLNVTVRRYEDSDRLTLDRLTLLDITSLQPINALTPRPAWRIHAGWEPVFQPDCRDCTAFNLSGSLGLAAETRRPWRAVWFALPGLELDYGDEFTRDHRAGPALTVGALLQPTPGWKMLASAAWLDYRLGETSAATRLVLQQNLALGNDWSLRADWRHQEGEHEFGVRLQMHF